MRIREAERAGKPFLVMRDDAGEQRLVTLPADATTVVVGRSEDSDVPIPWDDRVSRTHAQLVRVGTRWYVEDDGFSRNGTWVNEERVTGRRRLDDGDVLRAGHTAVLVRFPAQGSSSPTRPETRLGPPGPLPPGAMQGRQSASSTRR